MKRLFCCAALSLVLPFAVSHAQSTGTGSVNVSVLYGLGNTARLTAAVTPVVAADAPLAAVPVPTGSVVFMDGTTVLNAGGTPLIAGSGVITRTYQEVFGTPDAAVAAVAQGELSGDFNGDGEADLLIYGSNGPNSLQLQVSPGFGISYGGLARVSGRTLAPQTLALPGSGVPAVMDVDGDGKLDLLVGNSVAYGNGDGTFGRVAVLPALATGFNQTYAVDVNGDGRLDIVAVNTPPDPATATGTVQFTFTVFRNDGGGTFTSLGSFPLGAAIAPGSYSSFNVFGLSFADLNGDGKLDVISQSNSVAFGNAESGNNLHTILNNGDGTFATPHFVTNNSTTSLTYLGTAFADMNGDGKQDMVLAYSPNTGGNYVALYPGQGDGTFGTPAPVLLDLARSPGTTLQEVTLEDVNEDGYLDAVTGTGAVALGDGQGGLTLGTPLFPEVLNSSGSPIGYALLQASYLGGQRPTLFYLNLTTEANAVFTPQVSGLASLPQKLAPGKHVLTAQYSGDNNYAANVSPAFTFNVGLSNATVTLTSSDNPAFVGENVTFTATINSEAIPPTGSIVFSSGSTTLGTVAVSNGAASFTTSFAAAGNPVITAAYSGDDLYPASSGMFIETLVAPVSFGSGANTSLTVASGQSVTAPVSVAGGAGFSGMVNFSCTGLPANASCSFSPATVSVSGSAAASTMLTVSTAATATASAAGVRPFDRTAGLTTLACGCSFLGLLVLAPTRRRGLWLSLVATLCLTGAGLAGCGGNSGSTQARNKTAPGSYTFSVIAASGTNSTSASYTLTVQ